MKMLKLTIILALSAMLLATFIGTTYAITGNSQPDSTPYVGIVVMFSDQARTQAICYSTGILIAPDLVLTAGHTAIAGAYASVCFDQSPSYTIDSTGDMTFQTSQPIYNGVSIPYPDYVAATVAGAKPSEYLKTSDIGLIKLDSPVQEVTTFATLPTVNISNEINNHANLQVIGYGMQDQTNPMPMEGSITRNSATVQMLSDHFKGSDKYIKITENAAQGKGGVAFGDSGGPVIYNNNGLNTVIAVNTIVNNANCAGVSYATRVDTAQVLTWINGYL
jgi:V8-like Glu-specific endopeptidase